jgi:hypothetical protein
VAAVKPGHENLVARISRGLPCLVAIDVRGAATRQGFAEIPPQKFAAEPSHDGSPKGGCGCPQVTTQLAYSDWLCALVVSSDSLLVVGSFQDAQSSVFARMDHFKLSPRFDDV